CAVPDLPDRRDVWRGDDEDEAAAERAGTCGFLSLCVVVPVAVPPGQDEPRVAKRQVPEHRVILVRDLAEPELLVEGSRPFHVIDTEADLQLLRARNHVLKARVLRGRAPPQ